MIVSIPIVILKQNFQDPNGRLKKEILSLDSIKMYYYIIWFVFYKAAISSCIQLAEKKYF